MIEKRPYGFLCLLLCLIVCTALIGCSSDRGQKQGRETILFDSEWRFCKGDVENAEDPAYDDSKWRNLNLPHDWSIESTFSNCDTIELLINGKSLGTKALADFDDRMITWKNVPYQTGTINAIGINGGNLVCSHDLKTAGKAARINFLPDRFMIKADGYDLCHVMVSVSDANGIPVPIGSNDIQFQLSGPGKIIGVDNGDVTSLEAYRTKQRKLFYGNALVILQSTDQAGKIRLTASTTGLASDTLTINSNQQSYEN